MSDQQLAAAQQLYRALNLMPCACCYKWADHGLTQVKTKVCIRCKALKEWQLVVDEEG